jgi:hypothetical protein
MVNSFSIALFQYFGFHGKMQISDLEDLEDYSCIIPKITIFSSGILCLEFISLFDKSFKRLSLDVHTG